MTAAPHPRRNRIVAATLLGVAAGMVSLSFAAVPLYDLFCDLTGYGGRTQRAESAADRTLERGVIVRFDANISGLPWQFRPEVPQLHVKVGETALVNFIAENTGSIPTVGTATFNVQPDTAGIYFNKIECFCFTEQPLAPGERVEMPVQFFVSPDLDSDRQLNATRTITLSYTFFPAIDARQPVAQAIDDDAGKSM
jgi:cytochrome c oxidase assembly protein subunit 11